MNAESVTDHVHSKALVLHLKMAAFWDMLQRVNKGAKNDIKTE
jgi:hypothetical protein